MASAETHDLPSGGGGGGVDQVARDAAAAAQSDADAAGSVAQAASGAATTALNTAHTAQATGDAASGEIADHETNHPRQGTRVIIDTQEPAGSGFQIDDVWIRDAQFPSTLQLYRWTGSVWSVDYTLPSEINSVEMWARVNNSAKIPGAKTGVYLLPPGGTLPVPTETLFNENAAASLDGVWYYIAEHGHAASSNLWTWDDLNDGRVDLAQWRGVVSENPFSIQNPQTLDWAYISGEHRWVRRNSSTWVYTSAPAQYDSRYRSQHAAQQGGLIAVGKFIFVSSGHKMRVIRSYQGNAPGPTLYAWIAHDGPTLDLEDWAYRNNDVRIQPRKLADFGGHSINQIPDDGEQWYTLRARVHKNADGSLTSYDLADWTEEVIPEPSSGGASAYPPFYQATSSGAFTLTSTDSVIPGMTLPAVNFVAGEQWRFTATVALNGIGDTPHDLRVSLNIAGNAWVNVESREDDETSPSKFNVLIDHVITIPAGGGDVDVRAREASGNVITKTGTNLIAVKVAGLPGENLPDGMEGGGGSTTDQNARDAASRAQSDIDDHEASTHNNDAVARATAATNASNLAAHESTPHGGSGGGGTTDQTARDSAATAQAAADAAQTDVDTHEASTHNQDSTARASAATNADNLTDHGNLPHNTDVTARGAAATNATNLASHITNHPTGGGGGGGGATSTVLFESTSEAIGGSTALLTGDIVCPATGIVEVYFRVISGNRKGGVVSARIPAADLRTVVAALTTSFNQNDDNICQLGQGNNRGFGLAVQDATFYLMASSQAPGNFVGRILHWTE